MTERRSIDPHATSDAPASTYRPRRSAADAKRVTAQSVPVESAAAPRSAAEAEEVYVAARDAWTAAMKEAASGRPAALASLAIRQEEYEVAAAERERWLSGERFAEPVRADPSRAIDAVVGQELAWRRIHAPAKRRPGLLRRILGRVSRRH